MRVALADVGRVGRLDVRFGVHRGRTVIRHAYCEVPTKITGLQLSSLTSTAHLILMHTTAGLFGGDAVESAIHVEAGARVLITQQSATKVHPSRGLIARQRTSVRVDSGGELRLFLMPVIPFAGSNLDQCVEIDLAAGARLCLWEGLMAGRLARGEVWQFERLASETSLRLDGVPLYLDRFSLRPDNKGLDRPWVMGTCRYLGTGLRFDSDSATEFAIQLHKQLPDAGVDCPAEGLTCVRAVAESGPEYHRHAAGFRAAVEMLEMHATVVCKNPSSS